MIVKTIVTPMAITRLTARGRTLAPGAAVAFVGGWSVTVGVDSGVGGMEGSTEGTTQSESEKGDKMAISLQLLVCPINHGDVAMTIVFIPVLGYTHFIPTKYCGQG